ncbi:hypothetical protein [Streptomyces sp. 8L]|uniref:hypothetical protein n=1 Tax=Streptomyces sp. 8L TaxID=2877242 RepID=UPI001CD4A371|nr:hypothetical protein [Streptomyces sp. 8L]MCA1220246.1 hypothetical protein [Streptomyces sp. 8L]
MTLFQAPILTDGATHSAQQFRMLVRDLANGAEGITQGDDLKVTPLSTPGAAVQVADGSGIIRSKANSFGGSYSACNIGAASVDIASTGGSPRSDMVILRILDPEYEGDLDPATDPIMFFDVVSGVASTATTVPAGYTAIALARIDLPASTSTITAAMITDIRSVANPRRQRTLNVYSPTAALNEFGGNASVYSYWTNVPGWNIPIPDWATTARIMLTVCQIRFSTNDFFGNLSATFGASLSMQQTVLDDNGGTGPRRSTVVCADTFTLPDAYRGTTQLLRARGCGAPGNTGKVGMDSSVTLVADVEFNEAPR